jgi:hypothetical protein
VVGIIFNNGHRIKKVTAAYGVLSELYVYSNNASMVFYSAVLGINHFQNHLFFFLFNVIIQVCLRHYEESYSIHFII